MARFSTIMLIPNMRAFRRSLDKGKQGHFPDNATRISVVGCSYAVSFARDAWITQLVNGFKATSYVNTCCSALVNSVEVQVLPSKRFGPFKKKWLLQHNFYSKYWDLGDISDQQQQFCRGVAILLSGNKKHICLHLSNPNFISNCREEHVYSWTIWAFSKNK